MLRLLPRHDGFEAFGERQHDHRDEVLDQLHDPACWSPEPAFGVVDLAGAAHEARGFR